MTPIPDWSPSLATGNPGIDEQHRELVRMIRELHGRMEAGEHRQGVLDALQGMLAYAATHFEEEEELMEEAGWDGLDAHEGMHAEFLWKAGDFEAQVREDFARASREMLEYLLGWLVTHIQVEDRRFFETA
ncbi:MAG: bacteriohemerythrin [Thermodesulfobacteriota bacterium]|jgi:hemerythrin-like metal-binding protein